MTAPLTMPDKVVLLLTLIPFLREHGATPIAALAERFTVSPSEVRKLASFLGTAGVPGETRTYQHEDLFDINWAALEEEDVLELISTVGVEHTPRFSGGETAALLAGLHALRGALSGNLADLIDVIAAKLTSASAQQVHPVSLARSDGSPPLQVLGEALGERKRVRFRYTGRDGTTTVREVDPAVLQQHRDVWYLRGFCHTRQAHRTFRLDWIADAEILDVPLSDERPRDTTDAVLGDRWFEYRGEFLVRPEALHRIEGWNPEVLGTDDEGWIRVAVGLSHEQSAIELVAQAPGAVIANAPDQVRQSVSDWANGLLATDSDLHDGGID